MRSRGLGPRGACRSAGRPLRAGWLLAASLAVALGAAPAQAGALRFCDRRAPPDAAAQDRLLRFAALVRDTLAASGARLALVARSGLDLRRVGQRYSHAGVALRDADAAPWTIRQLYFACDEQRPRLFDEGLGGFVLATDDADEGYVSLLLLPEAATRPLEAAVRDNTVALSLLGSRYSANAYAYDVQFQNCNQWLVELLALAWTDADALPLPTATGVPAPDAVAAAAGAAASAAADGPVSAASTAPGDAARRSAQRWLAAHGYRPTEVHAGVLAAAVPLLPWLHNADHPVGDLARGVYRVSMPAAIDAFALALWPDARRIELCFRGQRVVLREGGAAIADGCVPAPGDTVAALD